MAREVVPALGTRLKKRRRCSERRVLFRAEAAEEAEERRSRS